MEPAPNHIIEITNLAKTSLKFLEPIFYIIVGSGITILIHKLTCPYYLYHMLS